MQEIASIVNLSQSSLDQFSEIIDVRSPTEFAEDHIPGAINLPVLDDRQRAEVGTMYCQHSRQQARRIGAAYVTKNISAYLDGFFASKPSNYRPLIYCWRGGMRSASMASILRSIGWYTHVVDGGYRTWRQHVISLLQNKNVNFSFVLIDGQTGTSKTKILHRLAAQGAQVIDLEALAEHRGSVFGGLAHTQQPSQKYFESLIYHRLDSFDSSRPVFLEAESPKIGRRAIPRTLVDAMRASPRIELHANLAQRAKNLVECYTDLIETPTRLSQAIEYLRPYHPRDKISAWLGQIDNKEFETLALNLIETHYDPCYARQRKKRNDVPAKIIRMFSLSDSSLDQAAEEIQKVANALQPPIGARPILNETVQRI